MTCRKAVAAGTPMGVCGPWGCYSAQVAWQTRFLLASGFETAADPIRSPQVSPSQSKEHRRAIHERSLQFARARGDVGNPRRQDRRLFPLSEVENLSLDNVCVCPVIHQPLAVDGRNSA